MTRKDYILIAEALRVVHNNAVINSKIDRASKPGYLEGSKDGQVIGIHDAVREVADAFARDNARFNREHFMAAVRGEKDLNSRPAR